MQHGLVGEYVLHPVREHHGDSLAGLEAEPDQSGCESQCLIAELPPGQGLPGRVAVAVGVGGKVTVVLGGLQQQPAERHARGLRFNVRALFDHWIGHCVLRRVMRLPDMPPCGGRRRKPPAG